MNKQFIYDYLSSFVFQNRIEKNDEIILSIKSASAEGDGEITIKPVLPGIALSNGTLNLKSCYQRAERKHGYIEIVFAKEGSYETLENNSSVKFISSGDTAISSSDTFKISASRVPSGHFKMISLLIKTEEAEKTLKETFPILDLSLQNLSNDIMDNGVVIIRGSTKLCHIFYEIEKNTENNDLLKLKIAELFIELKNEVRDAEKDFQFSKAVVERTRRCYSFLLKNTRHYTSKELSEKFKLAETSLRECFKSIYGIPLGKFQKEKTIREAARLLDEDSSISIQRLASVSGYENQSKFSAAFKRVIGVSPIQYKRKKSCHWKNQGSNNYKEKLL